jgi:hypothetical protein
MDSLLYLALEISVLYSKSLSKLNPLFKLNLLFLASPLALSLIVTSFIY